MGWKCLDAFLDLISIELGKSDKKACQDSFRFLLNKFTTVIRNASQFSKKDLMLAVLGKDCNFTPHYKSFTDDQLFCFSGYGSLSSACRYIHTLILLQNVFISFYHSTLFQDVS